MYDELNAAEKIIGEVKNVRYQSYTGQLRDDVLYAKKYGYEFRLHVRVNTKFSKPLQRSVDSGVVKRLEF